MPCPPPPPPLIPGYFLACTTSCYVLLFCLSFICRGERGTESVSLRVAFSENVIAFLRGLLHDSNTFYPRRVVLLGTVVYAG